MFVFSRTKTNYILPASSFDRPVSLLTCLNNLQQGIPLKDKAWMAYVGSYTNRPPNLMSTKCVLNTKVRPCLAGPTGERSRASFFLNLDGGRGPGFNFWRG